MTANEWQVSHTYAGGEMVYQVYRQRDTHRDIIGSFDSETAAQELADELNRESLIKRWTNEQG